MKKALKNFLFGVATAAHQIEGNNKNNDWWKYEKKITDGISSGLATNSWEMFEDDIKAIKDLGCNAYRFSLEWSRIEQEEGKFDQTAMDHYLHLIDRLKEENIEPIVCIHHFTNPIWFEDSGGWLREDADEVLAKYCKFVAPQIASKVKYIITFNEPNALLTSKYILGLWPPFKKLEWNNLKNIKKVINTYKKSNKNVISGHKSCYKIFKKFNKEVQVSICPQQQMIYARKTSTLFLSSILARIISYFSNNYHYDKLKDGYLDYLAVNIYTRSEVWFSIKDKTLKFRPDPEKHDFMRAYDQRPEDVSKQLRKLYKHYKLPILISENGTPNSDNFRIKYLKGIFEELVKLYKSKVELIGYIHWTLMDNFEWNHAFKEKFGFYSVEKDTFKRVPKNSASVYKRLIQNFQSAIIK